MSAAAQRAASWHEGILSASARGGFTSPAFRWAIAPALAAWLLLVWLLLVWLPSDNLALCLSPRATQIDGVLASIAVSYGLLNPWQLAAGWALMIVAMMFPLLVPMIGFVAARNNEGGAVADLGGQTARRCHGSGRPRAVWPPRSATAPPARSR